MSIIAQSLADGQLPASKGTLYAVPATSNGHITIVSYANTDTANAYSVSLYVKRFGGTSRRLLGASLTLAAGASLAYPATSLGVKLSGGDALEGDAGTANKIDYFIAGGLG